MDHIFTNSISTQKLKQKNKQEQQQQKNGGNNYRKKNSPTRRIKRETKKATTRERKAQPDTTANPQTTDTTVKYEVITFTNRDQYVGETFNGKPHGEGTMTKSNGDVYEGSFKNSFSMSYVVLKFSFKIII